MMLTMLKGKIHRATIRQAELDYVGSITVDPDLLDAAGILEYELVQVVDVDNGSRLETYTIAGERGSGMICLNGAAARLVQPGDKCIIMCYCQMDPEEEAMGKQRSPRGCRVVFVDETTLIDGLRVRSTGRSADRYLLETWTGFDPRDGWSSIKMRAPQCAAPPLALPGRSKRSNLLVNSFRDA